MHALLSRLEQLLAWWLAQPPPVQIVTALAAAAALYFLWVVVRITLVALYATFAPRR